MKYLESPCKTCPFRNSSPPIMHPGRLLWNLDQVRSGVDFVCHQTLRDSDPVPIPQGQTLKHHLGCAGARQMLANQRAIHTYECSMSEAEAATPGLTLDDIANAVDVPHPDVYAHPGEVCDHYLEQVQRTGFQPQTSGEVFEEAIAQFLREKDNPHIADSAPCAGGCGRVLTEMPFKSISRVQIGRLLYCHRCARKETKEA